MTKAERAAMADEMRLIAREIVTPRARAFEGRREYLARMRASNRAARLLRAEAKRIAEAGK